ncbi:helix-turn-helix domain-containing protein [Candidatus Methylospira mobilis]|uniref:Helix-turn-helix domain-containing protein n=1 Tax=Candidatus Methylospira mobilis TaxID=1808979 RepID=A0A5Q0BG84_9GAMM|nr:XRE family transcriptional regulator [Candidatus Methylospira mobilis]QFY42865.1 helix-turn-helix domain-containing protein [Candidatus Methylospira mobilis]
MTEVVKSGENLFLALGFSPYEAEILQFRADLMARLRLWINEQQLTQTEAAELLGVSQARVSDLVRGHWKKFSIDMLLTLAGKAGIKFKITLDQAA